MLRRLCCHLHRNNIWACSPPLFWQWFDSFCYFWILWALLVKKCIHKKLNVPVTVTKCDTTKTKHMNTSSAWTTSSPGLYSSSHFLPVLKRTHCRWKACLETIKLAKQVLEVNDTKISGGIDSFDSSAVSFDSFQGQLTQVCDGMTADRFWGWACLMSRMLVIKLCS